LQQTAVVAHKGNAIGARGKHDAALAGGGVLDLGGLLLWLTGPWIYTQVARVIDRVWLRRPYSTAEAERQFIRDVRGCGSWFR
jgi:hypothetical protein